MRTFKHFLNEDIKKRGDKFVVTDSSEGNVLGTHGSRKKALKQLAAVEISKKKRLTEQRAGILAGVLAVTPLMTGIAHAQHKVKSGDTLSHLAQKHGTTVANLAAHNKIADPNKIQIGQTINFPDKKKTTTPKPANTPKSTGSRLKDEDAFFDQLTKDEGYRGMVYDDHKGNPTIGFGHMFAADSKKRFEDAGIGDLYKGCRAGTCKLPEPAARKLMKTDYYRSGGYHERTKKTIPNFENLPAETQNALANAEYRGSLGISPNTVGLVNQGKGKEASVEFLNSDEYRTSKKAGTGVYKRMERNAAGLAGYTKTK